MDNSVMAYPTPVTAQPAPMMPQNVATPTPPPADASTPLHMVVKQLIANHPNETPDRIAQGLTEVGGIHPAVAAKVVSDVVNGGSALASAPTPSQGASSVNPISAPVPSASPVHDYVRDHPDVTPQALMNQFPKLGMSGALTTTSDVKNEQAKSALTNGPRSMLPWQPPAPSQSAYEMGAIPAPLNPAEQSYISGQSQAPTPNATTPEVSSQAPGAPSPSFQIPINAGQNPNAPAPPTPTNKPSGPSFLQKAGRVLSTVAPVLASVAIARNNPLAGGALMQGYNQGTAERKAQESQDKLNAAKASQQAIENKQHGDELAETKRYHDELAGNKTFTDLNSFVDHLKGFDAKSQQSIVEGLPDAQLKAIGVDKTYFYNPDGTFKAVTAAEKPVNTTQKSSQQVRAQGVLSSLDAPSQQNMHDSMDKDTFENTYGLPYESFKPLATVRGNASTSNSETRRSAEQERAWGDLTRMTPADQWREHDQYDGDPAKFEAKYGTPWETWQPSQRQTDVTAQGNLKERTRHDITSEHENEDRLKIAWRNSNTQKKRADDDANFKQWQENGGKVWASKTPSVWGSPWGKIFDDVVDKRDKASADLKASSDELQSVHDAIAADRKQNGPDYIKKYGDDPKLLARLDKAQQAVRHSNNDVLRLDNQIDHMNHVDPDSVTPAGGVKGPVGSPAEVRRSQAFKNKQLPVRGTKSVNPSLKASLRAKYGL